MAPEELSTIAQGLRMRHWRLQYNAGIDHIPSYDFTPYDHVLNTTCMLGLIPARYNWEGKEVTSDLMFSMARGAQAGGVDVTAMEMTKWFDTNYHYIVPEFEEGMVPKLACQQILRVFEEAKEVGIVTRPVMISPASFVALGKARYEGFDAVAFIQKIVPIYNDLLEALKHRGAFWVQMDEPLLAMNLTDLERDMIETTYRELYRPEGLKIIVTSYFDGLRDNADLAYGLPDDTVDAIHIDLRRGANDANTDANDADAQLTEALQKIGNHKMLSLGVVDGRNVWKNDLSKSLALIERAIGKIGKDRLMVGPSCSLLHTPVDLDQESAMDAEIKSWLAFAKQKIIEVSTLADCAIQGRDARSDALFASDQIQKSRKHSSLIHKDDVKARYTGINDGMKKRASAFPARKAAQAQAINLPAYPTTTIGSFPQTHEIRRARAAFKRGEIDEAAYKDAMKKEIREVVKYQQAADIDVLVHGEPERNDMVEYFGEQLDGFTFTQHGWVQSYGSRCVKPPIIYGDVARPKPMTVEWSAYAKSQTDRAMKGMLTGPITMLQWSFVRDDQPRHVTCTQIALAIRDEVVDLEAAGIQMIQIDEPAFREGLPMRHEDWHTYLTHAVDDFRLTACGVKDETQIHTHMCYSEFNDVIESIAALDADVISIETSRSQMELLDAFADFQYPNDIGPGVYDIHSPRVPSVEEMTHLLEKARDVIPERQIWVNPDCGLKTRGWKEVEPALKNMVIAAKEMRAKLGKQKVA